MNTTKLGIPRCDSCESSTSNDTYTSVSTNDSTSTSASASASACACASNQKNKRETCSNFFDIAINYLRNCITETPRKNTKSNESITKSVTSSDSEYLHSISSDENIRNLCIDDYETKITKSTIQPDSLDIFSITSTYDISYQPITPTSS